MRASASMLGRAFVLVASMATACAPSAPRPPAAGEREYPCILHPPSELSPDFSVSQHVEAAAGGRTGAFDSVVQKVGNDLVIVGLGPAGIRAFVLKQSGKAITFERMMVGPEMPFSPRNVVVDVHRAFFKRLPPGTTKGMIDDEEVEEDWRGNDLVERRFARPGTQYKGFVRVIYGPGCTRERCAPSSLRLVNEWFSYTLQIDCTDYNWF